MLARLPLIPYSVPGSGYFKIPKANCYVCYNPVHKRVEIFPVDGGWLGAEAADVMGDVAPFCD